MTSPLAQVIAAGRALDSGDREIAALALQHVALGEQEQIDAAWDEQIDRRAAEVLNGEVELVDGEETMAIVRARLAARRP